MTADQEQAERGASTVSNRGYWISQASLDDIAEREVQLRTDLERMTAEHRVIEEPAGQREQELHNKHAEAIVQFTRAVRRLEAERDAMRVALLKIEEIASRPSIADEERMSMVWQIVVLSLDARRKATAGAAEPPARAEEEGMSETLTVAPSASCDRQTHGGGRDFCATHQPGAGFWPCKESLETALVEARAVIAAVGMVHYPSRTGKWCRGCETLWPCDTHRALSAKRP